MAKVIGLATFLILGGSADLVHVSMSPHQTSIFVSDSVLSQYESSPLSKDQWLMRQALRSAPAFEADTDIDDVRAAVIEQNLLVLMESPNYLVVREGVPLIDMDGPIREKFIYGFEDDRLTLGPLTYEQAQSYFVSTGLGKEQIDTLQMFADADLSDANTLNAFAWLLATHRDPGIRNGRLAAKYARLAVDGNKEPPWGHVDTLAAAYAASGDFDSAVKYQRRAIELNYESDSGANERFEMYRNKQVYISPVVYRTAADVEATPKPELIVAAASGSAEDQWLLARFYLEKEITEGQGMMNPGLFWLQQAAENGHEFALNELGYCHLMADCGVDWNFVEAARWFERAADTGDATGAFNYSRLLAYGLGVERDDRRATELMHVAADQGITAAAFHAALRHREGVGIPANGMAHKKYMKQVEAARYGPAEFLLDDHFFQQFFGAAAVAAELDRSGIHPYQMGDALMNIVKQIEQAPITSENVITVDFHDTPIDYELSYRPHLMLQLTRVAAGVGSTRAQLRYAQYFEEGRLVTRSLAEANYWKARAAQ